MAGTARSAGRRRVLVAVPDAFEGAVVAALDAVPGVDVAHRCADLPDLLTLAGAGAGDIALVSAGLRRLDRTSVVRLARGGVVPVGVSAPGDEESERHLRRLGVDVVVSAAAPPGAWLQAFDAAAAGLPPLPERPGQLQGELRWTGQVPPASWWPGGGADSTRGAASDAPRPGSAPDGSGADAAAPGRIVAVWGPTGAPGRSFVATSLAVALAGLRVDTLLVDADPYGGVHAQLLGLLDEAPGFAAAVRAADAGLLDVPGLAGCATPVLPHLHALTGFAEPSRWEELRAPAVDEVLRLTRRLSALTVVDCGFCLEGEEEFGSATSAPGRNATTLAALAAADVLVVVGAADPVGLRRLISGLSDLDAVEAPADRCVVLNRVRPHAAGPRPAETLGSALGRHTGVGEPFLVPEARELVDAAVFAGRSVVETHPRSPVALALGQLARVLLPAGATSPSSLGVGPAQAGRGRIPGRGRGARGGRISALTSTGHRPPGV